MHLKSSNNFSDNILTFGGVADEQYQKSVEVHHNLGDNNNTTCQIQDLAKATYGHSGVNTKLGIVYCGGLLHQNHFDQNWFDCIDCADCMGCIYQNDCYRLSAENEGWVPFKSLKYSRSIFTMNEINDNLIAIGGLGSATSLEHINLETGTEWKQKQFNFSIDRHCSVVVDEKTILMIGGELNFGVRNNRHNRSFTPSFFDFWNFYIQFFQYFYVLRLYFSGQETQHISTLKIGIFHQDLL